MVTVDGAAILIGVSSRAIFRLVESGDLHFAETPDKLLLICRNSLWGNTRRVVSGGDHDDG